MAGSSETLVLVPLLTATPSHLWEPRQGPTRQRVDKEAGQQGQHGQQGPVGEAPPVHAAEDGHGGFVTLQDRGGLGEMPISRSQILWG